MQKAEDFEGVEVKEEMGREEREQMKELDRASGCPNHRVTVPVDPANGRPAHGVGGWDERSQPDGLDHQQENIRDGDPSDSLHVLSLGRRRPQPREYRADHYDPKWLLDTGGITPINSELDIEKISTKEGYVTSSTTHEYHPVHIDAQNRGDARVLETFRQPNSQEYAPVTPNRLPKDLKIVEYLVKYIPSCLMRNMDPISTIQLRRALAGETWMSPLETICYKEVFFGSNYPKLLTIKEK
ncbi:hypothetical protein O988_00332 [Pseudogymnoascus sp. VKM F-3808]|nr:hypothetical protein O988_00332 [Pseudogymnoascus sp. VKM F-3808]